MAAEISFKNIKRHDVQKIGMAYINHLVEKGDYDGAARSVYLLQGYSPFIYTSRVLVTETLHVKCEAECFTHVFIGSVERGNTIRYNPTIYLLKSPQLLKI